ncbi:hypothetical protein NZK27_01385 [Synechococcus sp. FGCU-3]|jgi:hypothetical protein|nr:hypothetical protein [Synechococcus sp. FGCU3]
MAPCQTLGRDVARLVRHLSDDDLAQFQVLASRGPSSPRALAFGVILRRERQRRLGERVQRMERCLWLSRRRGRCWLAIRRALQRFWRLLVQPARRRCSASPSA